MENCSDWIPYVCRQCVDWQCIISGSCSGGVAFDSVEPALNASVKESGSAPSTWLGVARPPATSERCCVTIILSSTHVGMFFVKAPLGRPRHALGCCECRSSSGGESAPETGNVCRSYHLLIVPFREIVWQVYQAACEHASVCTHFVVLVHSRWSSQRHAQIQPCFEQRVSFDL